MFEILPAIDIKDGKCVRLFQGKKDTAKIYFDDPLDVAKMYKDYGLKKIHVVDLDGAFEGKPKNYKILEKIINLGLKVQYGGGLRSFEIVKNTIELGVERVVIGTLAVKNSEEFKKCLLEFPKKIVLAIDTKDFKVTSLGWEKVENLDPISFAKRWEENYKNYLWGYLFTDISKDGSLEGPNFEAIKKFSNGVSLPVLASGGVSNIEDILKLKEIENVKGVIIGKAIYENKISLKDLKDLAIGYLR
ncbi:MAG TPA: 1-(5-phosphoribosyl)-5-[(5-phosphoribosylamino)methylideneamino]imidazole-4-carboxamide isomerase [Desulfurobacteriaceae bacterium]|nr:1-(5-phosphoribosyl)-5-[(5-phosphoribosylamino)methylideneamino]imidazole-4-carboxamide isomerase [Desulfurobacteriaceae bacterium]